MTNTFTLSTLEQVLNCVNPAFINLGRSELNTGCRRGKSGLECVIAYIALLLDVLNTVLWSCWVLCDGGESDKSVSVLVICLKIHFLWAYTRKLTQLHWLLCNNAPTCFETLAALQCPIPGKGKNPPNPKTFLNYTVLTEWKNSYMACTDSINNA